MKYIFLPSLYFRACAGYLGEKLAGESSRPGLASRAALLFDWGCSGVLSERFCDPCRHTFTFNIYGILLTLLSKETCNRSFTHRRWSQPRRATASLSGAVRMRCLAQGHLDTQLGGAGDPTSNLPVNSQPTLPPEVLPP